MALKKALYCLSQERHETVYYYHDQFVLSITLTFQISGTWKWLISEWAFKQQLLHSVCFGPHCRHRIIACCMQREHVAFGGMQLPSTYAETSCMRMAAQLLMEEIDLLSCWETWFSHSVSSTTASTSPKLKAAARECPVPFTITGSLQVFLEFREWYLTVIFAGLKRFMI